MEPIIIAKELSKMYVTKASKFRALNKVDVEITEGEICAIVGTSGSGKSTLLSILAGLEHPSSGKIYIKKKPIHKMTENELVNFRLNNIGFVFQSFNLMNTMTALENVAMPLMFRGISPKERNLRAKKILTQMGLKSHIKHKPMELSGGQQQRVSIARALISKPEIIFADEPTGNLDSNTSVQIMEIMVRAAKKRGATLVFVTHDPEKALYANKIIHIIDGKVDKVEMNTTNLIYNGATTLSTET